MQKIITLSLCLFFIFFAKAQDTVYLKKQATQKIITDREPQAFYAELGGNGVILSANYDRRFNKTAGGLGFRIGLGNSFDSYTTFTTLPVGINYLLGKRGHYFEAGIGGTLLLLGDSKDDLWSIGGADIDQNKSTLFATVINMGYRRQPVTGGFNFRGGVSPFFINGQAAINAYLSFGYNF